MKLAVASFFDELTKLGAISDDQAQAALNRLDTLERTKPSAEQALRYAGLGAGAGVLSRGLGDLVEHGAGSMLQNFAPRRYGAAALTGGLMAGAMPVINSALNQRAEKATLKKYLAQAAPSAESPAGVDLPDVPPVHPEN